MFGQKALDFAVSYGKGIGDVNDALFDTISAGISSQDAFEFLEAAGKASVGGFIGIKTAVGGAVSVLNAYNMSIKDTTKVYDAMFAANVKGITTFEELSTSVGTVASFAAQVGVGYQELFGAFAGITKITKNTQTAATGMKSLFAAIIKPSGDAAGLAEMLGIDLSKTGLQKAGGLQAYMADVMKKVNAKAGKKVTITTGKGKKKKTKETTLEDSAGLMAKLFGSVEAFNVAAVLTSKSAMQGMTEAMELMQKGGSLMDKSFGDASSGVQFKLSQLKSAWDVFLVEMGAAVIDEFGTDGKALADKLIGWMKDAKKGLKSFMQGIRDFVDLVKKLLPYVGTAFTAYIGISATSDLMKFGKHLQAIAPGIEGAFGQKAASAVGGFAGKLGLITGALTAVYTIASTIATLVDQEQEKVFEQKRMKMGVSGGLEALGMASKQYGAGSRSSFIYEFMKEREDKYLKTKKVWMPNDVFSPSGTETVANQDLYEKFLKDAAAAYEETQKSITKAIDENAGGFKMPQGFEVKTFINVTGENVKVGDAKTEMNTGKAPVKKAEGSVALGSMAGGF
jgi:TP901 family phage tail tape measure protein